MSVTEQITRLEKLGMTEAAAVLKEQADLAPRLAVAYEHYRFVTEEQVADYQTRLRKATENSPPRMTHHGDRISYDELAFDAPDKYPGTPPADVLDAMEQAAALRAGGRVVFDAFEIAHVVSVQKMVDPLLFARITGCGDRFFIAQWGDDVKITDLLGEHDG